MEKFKGKSTGETNGKITAVEKKKHDKLLKSNTSQGSRSIETLIHEFETSVGNFNAFHSNMNGREKILFKEYIGSMRDAIT
jgi:hypothetical protein